jgi:hypothetical protein
MFLDLKVFDLKSCQKYIFLKQALTDQPPFSESHPAGAQKLVCSIMCKKKCEPKGKNCVENK